VLLGLLVGLLLERLLPPFPPPLPPPLPFPLSAERLLLREEAEIPKLEPGVKLEPGFTRLAPGLMRLAPGFMDCEKSDVYSMKYSPNVRTKVCTCFLRESPKEAPGTIGMM
jgi:hypothetical protein